MSDYSQFYLFLSSYGSNWVEDADTDNSGAVTKREFKTFITNNWNGEETPSDDLISSFWKTIDTQTSSSKISGTTNADKGALNATELANLNEKMEIYDKAAEYINGVLDNCPSFLEGNYVTAWKEQVKDDLWAVAAACIAADSTDETSLIETLTNSTNGITNKATVECYWQQFASTDEIQNYLIGYDYKIFDDSDLESIIKACVSQLTGSETAEDLKTLVENIINSYLSTAGLGDATYDTSLLSSYGYPAGNATLNDLQIAVLKESITQELSDSSDFNYGAGAASYDSALNSYLSSGIAYTAFSTTTADTFRASTYYQNCVTTLVNNYIAAYEIPESFDNYEYLSGYALKSDSAFKTILSGYLTSKSYILTTSDIDTLIETYLKTADSDTFMTSSEIEDLAAWYDPLNNADDGAGLNDLQYTIMENLIKTELSSAELNYDYADYKSYYDSALTSYLDGLTYADFDDTAQALTDFMASNEFEAAEMEIIAAALTNDEVADRTDEVVEEMNEYLAENNLSSSSSIDVTYYDITDYDSFSQDSYLQKILKQLQTSIENAYSGEIAILEELYGELDLDGIFQDAVVSAMGDLSSSASAKGWDGIMINYSVEDLTTLVVKYYMESLRELALVGETNIPSLDEVSSTVYSSGKVLYNKAASTAESFITSTLSTIEKSLVVAGYDKDKTAQAMEILQDYYLYILEYMTTDVGNSQQTKAPEDGTYYDGNEQYYTYTGADGTTHGISTAYTWDTYRNSTDGTATDEVMMTDEEITSAASGFGIRNYTYGKLRYRFYLNGATVLSLFNSIYNNL